MNPSPADRFRDRRVLVMGLGLFGGGVACAKFMCRHGAQVTVTDLADEKKLAPSVEALKGLPVRLVLGRHDEVDFQSADFLLPSPAVPPDSPWIALAVKHGAKLETEMNLFFELNRLPVVGVTGSNGKTTTTTLIHLMLQASNVPCYLGGNIGKPLLNDAEEMNARGGTVVLEMSSFQLEALAPLRVSPKISVVTNVTPNHIDRHKTFENYAAAKKNIARFQKPGDLLVLNANDEATRTWAKDAAGRVALFSLNGPVAHGAWMENGRLLTHVAGNTQTLIERGQFRLVGDFNIANALAASCAALAAGATVEAARQVLATFQGVEHRIEFVAEIGGARYYNDSKSTTPEATEKAVSAMRWPTHLILGGYDKGVAFDAMAEEIARATHVVHVAVLGVTKPAVTAALRKAGYAGLLTEHDTFDAAFDDCARRARPGEAVLLSPACPSYDLFSNFIERGNHFKTRVRSLKH